MTIADNKVVSIHYTLTNAAGETLDSSAGAEPMAYIHGMHGIIPGLENALAGKAVGEELKVTVSPEEGYGVSDPNLIQEVPRAAFGEVDKIEVGMQFQGQNEEGMVQHITVKAVSDEKITIDANHPLADEVLSFDVKIEGIRDATAEEIEHGHVHDGNSHH
ncbi:MAG: peptidylprolyl isomerase [Planctomycetota bacterium]